MRVQVKDESHPLCSRCRHGSIRKFRYSPDALLYCADMGKYLRTQISECTEFSQRGSLTYQEMKGIAWIIDKEEANKIGFIKPSDKRHKEAIAELPYSHPLDND